MPGIGVVGTYIPKHSIPTFHPSSLPEMADSIDRMIKEGIFPENDRPLILGLSFSADPPEQQFIRCNDRVLKPGGKPSGFPPKCDDVEAQLTAATADPSRAATDSGLQLMSLYALKHSAEEGLKFLNKLQNDLKMPAKP